MTETRIAAAQVASVSGDIEHNVATHIGALAAASRHGVSLLVFPELSLTGYEPGLAQDLALSLTDDRLAPLLDAARRYDIEAVVGAPLREGTGKPKIGGIVVGRDGITAVYRKMHLGGVEANHFAPGDTPLLLTVDGHKVGIAICADTSRETHPENYVASGARIYAAGVFLTAEWYPADESRLAGYASGYGMLTIMANHVASVGSLISVGKSAIWSPGGEILVRAADTGDALLIATGHDNTWRGTIAAL